MEVIVHWLSNSSLVRLPSAAVYGAVAQTAPSSNQELGSALGCDWCWCYFYVIKILVASVQPGCDMCIMIVLSR